MSSQSIVPTGLGSFLRSVPYEISGQWFHQTQIMLDGFSFTNCRFDNCQIHISQGPFKLDHCFMSNCTIVYGNGALGIVRLFVRAHLPNSLNLPAFIKAVENIDGTFSIDSQSR